MDPEINHFNELYPDFNSDMPCRYYDTDSLNSSVSSSERDLCVFHMNIRSLFNKHDDFCNFLGVINCTFDVVCITETWLNCDDPLGMVNLVGYVPFHSTREGRGGGVSAYVRSGLLPRRLDHLCVIDQNIECMFVEFIVNKGRVLIGCVYRPPQCSIDLFFGKLDQILSSLPSYCECIVAGDFNINLLGPLENDNSVHFLNIMSSHSLLPTITKPTRIDVNTSTLLDNIFVTKPEDIVSGNIFCTLSDHFPNFLIFKNYLISENSRKADTVYSYRKVDDSSLYNLYMEIAMCDFSSIIECDDVDLAVNSLADVVFSCYDRHCPVIRRTVSYKTKLKPWISDDIRSDIRKRQHFDLLCKQGKMHKAVYRRFRNYVTSKIRAAKKSHFSRRFVQCKDNLKKTWRLINSVIKPNHELKVKTIVKLIDGESIYSDPLHIAEKFNVDFANVGRRIAESCPTVGDNFAYWLSGNYCSSFQYSPLSSSDVFKIMNSLENKSCPVSVVPIRVHKYISDIVSPILCILINKSVISGVFPESLKMARVIPLHKGGDSTSTANYRPISILSCYSKIYEKAVHRQLYRYFEDKEIFFNGQFGFRKGRGTSQSCIGLMQYLYDNLDKGNNVLSLFLDFQKAFDSVDHRVLLYKLYHYGIRGFAHDWLKSYLSGRSQCVTVDNVTSSTCFLTHGVPQGSVLGPFLFLVLINDLPNSSNILRFNLFADDSTVTYSFSPRNSNLVSNIVNRELDQIFKWLCSNKIKINAEKTKFIIFSYRHKVTIPELKLGESVLEQAVSAKFLGLLLDENLRFDLHIEHIARKVSKSSGILNKVKHHFPTNIMLNLYYSLIYPYLTYAIESWFNAPNYLTNRITVLQKRCLRNVYNLPYDAHTIDYFITSKILTLPYIYRRQVLIYMFKTINAGYDCNLLNMLVRNREVHSVNTRNRNDFVLPRYRRTISQNCILFKGVELWNSLPMVIRNAKSLFIFKKHIGELYNGLL